MHNCVFLPDKACISKNEIQIYRISDGALDFSIESDSISLDIKPKYKSKDYTIPLNKDISPYFKIEDSYGSNTYEKITLSANQFYRIRINQGDYISTLDFTTNNKGEINEVKDKSTYCSR